MPDLKNIAYELLDEYRAAKRSGNKKTFSEIIVFLFGKYGNKFDFGFKEFRAAVLRTYHCIQREKSSNISEPVDMSVYDNENDEVNIDINEGSGRIFVEDQIKRLGLNPNSY